MISELSGLKQKYLTLYGKQLFKKETLIKKVNVTVRDYSVIRFGIHIQLSNLYIFKCFLVRILCLL